jgi:hypothetical protein
MSINVKSSTVPVQAVIVAHLAVPVEFLTMGPVRPKTSFKLDLQLPAPRKVTRGVQAKFWAPVQRSRLP